MSQFKYVLVVLRCDNRIKATINGSVIYNKYVDFDPALNDQVDFTNNLQSSPGTNNLIIQGFNGPTTISTPAQINSYHFTYQVWKINKTTNAMTILASNDLFANPNSQPMAEWLVMTWNHVIVLE